MKMKLFSKFWETLDISLECEEFFGISFTRFSLFPLTSQLIYYYNHRNGIKPTFLRVFQMMSGLVSPKSLGLTDGEEIKRLLNITRRMKPLIILNNEYIFPFIGFTFVEIFYLVYGSPMEALIYGVPNAVLWSLFAKYFGNILFFQVLCFHVNCLYLKFKINNLNERLIEMKRRKRFLRIRETLQSFDSLYSEINEYNTTFWSKFLFIFWLTYGLIGILFLYITLFVPTVISELYPYIRASYV